MKKLKSNLDERQESQLMHIEKNGCWFAFWALLASLFIQQWIFGITDIKAIAGEGIVFMILAIYLLAACIKNGIWDRHFKADRRTNLIISAVTAVVLSAVLSAINYWRYGQFPSVVIAFAFMCVFSFVLLFGALSFFAALYKKRAKKLEGSEEEE